MEAKMVNIINHLKDVEFPVTGRKFMEACENMSDISDEQKRWVRDNIDLNKTYRSADEIRKALRL